MTPGASIARALAAAALVVVALVAAPRSAVAQQSDSIARRDSILAERERARIRRDRVRTTAPSSPDSGTAARAPERSRRPRWRAELGAAAGARYVEDPNGVTVKSGVHPLAGVGAAWLTGARTTLALTARVSGGSLRVEGSGGDWDGGSVVEGDLLGTVEWSLHPRAALRGGVGATWLRGPSDLVPFRESNDTPLHGAIVVGASARVLRARPLDAFLDVHATRYGGATVDDPVSEPGTVTRFVLGLRYGR